MGTNAQVPDEGPLKRILSLTDFETLVRCYQGCIICFFSVEYCKYLTQTDIGLSSEQLPSGVI